MFDALMVMEANPKRGHLKISCNILKTTQKWRTFSP